MKFLSNAKKIVFFSFVFLGLTDCKTRTHRGIEGQSNGSQLGLAAPEQAKPLNLTLTSTSQTQTYTVTRSSKLLASPLSFLNIVYFDQLTALGMNVVDFKTTGSLYNVSNANVPPSSCFQVGIYSVLMGSNEYKLLLDSAFQDTPTVGLPASLKHGDFNYCETANEINITIPNDDVGAQFVAYFIQRGLDLVLANNALGGFGDLVSSLKKNLGEEDGTGNTSHSRSNSFNDNEDRVVALREAEQPSLESLNKKGSRSAKTSSKVNAEEVDKTVSARFNKQETEPAYTRLSKAGHDADLETYNLLKTRIDRRIRGQNIGEGAFAKVYKIRINHKDYIIRDEPLGGGWTPAEREQYVNQQRMNFLIQNEFAKKRPDANFVKTQLACLTPDGRFVTISEFRGGGELFAKINDDYINGLDPFTKSDKGFSKNIAEQQLLQSQIYEDGIEVEVIKGQKHLVSFFHNDIKPENIILDKAKKISSYIDPALGRIVVRKEKKGVPMELAINPEGDTVTKILTVSGTSGKSTNVVTGTVNYWSPEVVWFQRNPEFEKTGEEAVTILTNINRHSLNLQLLMLLTQDRGFPWYFRDAANKVAKMPNDLNREEMLNAIGALPPKRNELRPFVKIDDFKSKVEEKTLEEYYERIDKMMKEIGYRSRFFGHYAFQ